ncbi:MAG: 3'-5' exonuclease, partial [Planctomycetota bacterium]|nr:3'-5' exonuclease [Planctomycetota bacterium]
EFEQHYPSAQVITLGQNFRSTAPILAVADALIRNNKRRKHKDLFTSRDGGARPIITLCQSEHHEATLVADWLQRAKDGRLEPETGDEGAAHEPESFSWKDMAVFYRTNALSRVMEDELRRRGVPYVIARGTAFYDREEIRNAVAYLRVLANPADEVSLRGIINRPTRGIGAATISVIETHAAQHDITMWDALRAVASGAAVSGDLTARAVNAVTKFVNIVEGWTGAGTFMGQTVASTLSELVERVVKESGLIAHYKKAGKKGGAGDEAPDEDRLANLAELVSSAHEFELEYQPESDPAEDAPQGESPPPVPPLLAMLRGYLESVALVADADAVDPAQGAVTLMTLHAAKGLEFPIVAMIGLEDGLLPHSRSRESEAELEEERRLCFVGITRAMRRLMLTSARTRTLAGVSQRTIPSAFLNELPEDHIIVSDQTDSWIDDADDIDPWATGAGRSTWGRRAAPAASSPALGKRWGALAARAKQNTEPDGFDFDDYAYDPDPEQKGIAVGARVRHPQFGEGKVESVTKGVNARAKIRFDHIGTKTLVLQYARLQIL